MKTIVDSLFTAAKNQDGEKINSTINSIPAENRNYAFIDFIKWSVPYDEHLREFILPFFLRNGVNVNTQDKVSGYTALMYASTYSLSLIKPLMDAGADVKIKAQDGSTALLCIVSKNKPDLVRLFLDKGADPNTMRDNGYSPLLGALRPMFAHYTEDTVTTVKYLLDAGASVDIKDPYNGETPLQIVAYLDEPLPDIASKFRSLLTEHGAK